MTNFNYLYCLRALHFKGGISCLGGDLDLGWNFRSSHRWPCNLGQLLNSSGFSLLICKIIEMEDKVTSPEKAEEAKLKARYPHLGQKPGGSDFLRKRLQKGQKYFDSGDYNMAKAKMKNKQLPTATPDKTEVTGDHIPTPQDLPQRKPSLVASKLAG
uniref:cAMP-regulated phosphoprotein 19 n=1 Tax=Bos taurus TaxID=9913 RepID=A0A3Q1NE41_BOVIN